MPQLEHSLSICTWATFIRYYRFLSFQRSDEYFQRHAAARSSISDKVKGMRRDVKKKISRLRTSTANGREEEDTGVEGREKNGEGEGDGENVQTITTALGSSGRAK